MRMDIDWPAFHNNGITYPTEFVAGSWKCPICCRTAPRIRQHLSSHKDLVQDLECVESYCKAIAALKRRELERVRAQKPERGRKDPRRKEVLIKADAKRAEDPKRKEVLRKVDAKRAEDPRRKETVSVAMKKYAQTKLGRLAKVLAQERWLEKLGETRRRAKYRKYKQTQVDKVRGGDALARRIRFQKGVQRGPVYACSSCHRMLYKKSVTSVTEKMREKIKLASEEKVRKAFEERSKAGGAFKETLNSKKSFEEDKGGPAFKETLKSKLKKKSNKFEADAFKAWNHYMLKSVGDLCYLCSTCKSSLQKGNIPAMGVANGLELSHPDRPILTELENSLIAMNINFQKIVLLPRSRMAAGKGRMISIPIGPSDVMNTAKQLPRLPTEAGVIPVKLKRKKEYKSHEKSEWVRPEQIFLALRYLAKAKNPYYQFYDDEKTYKARCRIKDQRGLRLLEDDKDNIEEDLGKPEVPGEVEVEDQAVRDSDDEGEDEMEIAMEKEEEDIENDPVRRQHFNYNEYSTLVNGHPEIFLDNEGNQAADLDFAPGEGKKPTDPQTQKDWDVKSWPLLLPDGRFGLSHDRKVKLTKQNYFQQRLLNKDDRFARHPDFTFAAMSVVEAERLRANANLTGMRGKKSVGPGGHVVLQVGDPCVVFEKIPGTPKYWQRVRYEIIAKLENIGPFQIFFTLTSGDLRWSANFTPELEKLGCKIHYRVDQFGKDDTVVEVKDGKKTIEKPWLQYLRDHVDGKQHAMMKRNVLLATRNFQHRVETFRKEIIFGNNNPMKVRHISYRVEFQGRGAAHIHGVLWLDLDEIKVEGVNNAVLKESYSKLKNSEPLEPYEMRALEKFTDTFVTCTRCVNVAGAEAVKIAEETNWHGHSNSCKKGGARLCRWKFPRYPLERTIFVDANKEYGEEGRMPAKERIDILDRVMGVLVQEEGGRMVLSRTVKRIMLRYPNVRKIDEEESDSEEEHEKSGQSFEETKTFQEAFEETQTFQEAFEETQTLPEAFEETLTSQHSPRPFEETLKSCPGRKKLAKKRTRQPLAEDAGPKAKKAKKKPNTVTYIKMESPEEYKKNIRERIDKVLKKASAGGEPITYEQYEKAVIEQPRKGSEVLLQRDIDEIFINNYNSEWITNWDANIDISPVYDYYGTITYITDYFTKVGTIIQFSG